jgi:hypothetical protein
MISSSSALLAFHHREFLLVRQIIFVIAFGEGFCDSPPLMALVSNVAGKTESRMTLFNWITDYGVRRTHTRTHALDAWCSMILCLLPISARHSEWKKRVKGKIRQIKMGFILKASFSQLTVIIIHNSFSHTTPTPSRSGGSSVLSSIAPNFEHPLKLELKKSWNYILILSLSSLSTRFLECHRTYYTAASNSLGKLIYY